MDMIIDRLYISNDAHASCYDLLASTGITHIVVAGKELSPHFPNAFTYLKLEIRDNYSESILIVLEKSNEFIASALRAGGKVLVHCYQGVSRSSSIILGYLISQRFSYNKALNLILKKHARAKPNMNFVNQLLLYDRQVNVSACCVF